MRDARALAIKCFVYATNEHVYYNVPRRIAWMLRGLNLWEEATGQDTSRERAEVAQYADANIVAHRLVVRR